ncbi:hypothetical protein H2278_07150 [Campylobacter sp. W0018]|nr:hypothetical protein [Campylobacter sp. W0018]
MRQNIKNKFNSVYENKNYNELLKVFDQKGIYTEKGFLSKVGKTKEAYDRTVLKLLKENKKLQKRY